MKKEITLYVDVQGIMSSDEVLRDRLTQVLSGEKDMSIDSIQIEHEKIPNPSKGEYHPQGDGSYRMYTGPERGWILCDDWNDLREELEKLD